MVKYQRVGGRRTRRADDMIVATEGRVKPEQPSFSSRSGIINPCAAAAGSLHLRSAGQPLPDRMNATFYVGIRVKSRAVSCCSLHLPLGESARVPLRHPRYAADRPLVACFLLPPSADIFLAPPPPSPKTGRGRGEENVGVSGYAPRSALSSLSPHAAVGLPRAAAFAGAVNRNHLLSVPAAPCGRAPEPLCARRRPLPPRDITRL
jgi:hypothetical protein